VIDCKALLDSLRNYDDGEDQFDAAVRLVCSTVRRCNQTYTDLERLKEATGFNKTFPFLSLPWEIRDEIYNYSFFATVTIPVTPITTSAADIPYKPSTPGLMRANKQIYRESIDILYGKNMFVFSARSDVHFRRSDRG